MSSSRGTSWCLLFGLVGVGLAGYLTYLHLGMMRGELLGGPACDTGTLNCHAVTASAWSSFLGLPLALWGLLGYLLIVALALLGRQSPEWAARTMTLTALLALVFVGADLALLWLMAFVIGYYCLFCLLTYAVNLLLLLASLRSLPLPRLAALGRAGAALRSLVPSGQRPATWLFWGLVSSGVSGIIALHLATMFVMRGTLGGSARQIREFITTQPRLTLNVSGSPVKGPTEAPLRLVEFSDFLCPACQRATKLNTIIFASHRRDAQLIFKHFPLDTSCNDKIGRMVHPGACQLAAASECANLQGKFWLFHDRVFELIEPGGGVDPNQVAKDPRVGLDAERFQECLASGQGMEAVKRDIADGAGIGVTSTPTFVLNGLRVGAMTPPMFEEFTDVLREVGY